MNATLPRSFHRLRCLVLAPALFVGCGGSVASSSSGADAGASSGDAAVPSDAGGSAVDSGVTAPGECTASAPALGAPCTGALQCEYGESPDVDCDTVFQCSSAQWIKKSGEAPSCTANIPGSPDCPATYAALRAQTTCSPTIAQCYYPEANCSCATHCGMLGMSQPFWCCPDGPSGEPGCPTVRPRIGTSCTMPSAVCDYGGCNGNVTLECTGGTWQPTETACPG